MTRGRRQVRLLAAAHAVLVTGGADWQDRKRLSLAALALDAERDTLDAAHCRLVDAALTVREAMAPDRDALAQLSAAVGGVVQSSRAVTRRAPVPAEIDRGRPPSREDAVPWYHRGQYA